MAPHRRTNDERRILAAINKMPRARAVACESLARCIRERAELTLEVVADYLEALIPVLEEAENEEKVTEDELGALRADLAARGRLRNLEDRLGGGDR